jgi:hypothetical protein
MKFVRTAAVVKTSKMREVEKRIVRGTVEGQTALFSKSFVSMLFYSLVPMEKRPISQ